MKLTPMRAVACELAWAGLALLATEAQNAQPDLTALQIEDLLVPRSAHARPTWRF
jgi:hypothetical protein